MPAKDPSKTGKRAVDTVTGDNPRFDAQSIIADPALRARLRDVKEEIARTTKKPCKPQ
jgi:hypothetical protein